MSRFFRLSGIVVLAVIAALYVGDWLIFKLRGSPTDKVTVSLFISVPLNGPPGSSKQEIDFIGQEQWSCAQTIFPQIPYLHDQSMPCWYLRRHTNQTTTY
ncbi:MAG TPA: hypothetical protein VF742_14750 [Terracidiphilus sp.]|jgi:hypothetical protein